MTLPTPYYDRDGITIYCGDNRDILPHLGRFDLLLTDPPYGIGFAAQPTKWQREAGMIPKDWDSDAPDISACVDAASDAIVWGGNYLNLPPRRCWLSWYKPDAPPSMGNVEYAWTTIVGNSRMFQQSISRTNAERVGHPTQKPKALMCWCLKFFPDAETILDPFAGSGTTLLAAKLEGRRAVGIEINPEYCEIAKNRLRQTVFEFTEAQP